MVKPALRFAVGLLPGLLLTPLLLGAAWLRLAERGLPELPMAVLSCRDAAPLILLDAWGRELHSESACAPVQPAEPRPRLVEAFLSASSPGFYEARRQPASRRMAGLLRILSAIPPASSPLSVELARIALRHERAGARRGLREERLARQLDASMTVQERAQAWLETVPLCWGAPGLRNAGERCLGVPVEDWELREEALVAGVALGRVDLSAEPRLLSVRRDLLLDSLVRQGTLEPTEALELRGEPRSVPLPAGPGAFVPPALLELRWQARVSERVPTRVATSLRPDLQQRLAAEPELQLGAWAVLSADGSEVLALGGDALRHREIPPEISILHRIPGKLSCLDAARLLSRRAGPAAASAVPRFVRSVEASVRRAPRPPEWTAWAARLPEPSPLSPEESWIWLDGLSRDGAFRVLRAGPLTLFLHADFVGALALAHADATLSLDALLGPLVKPREFPPPDGVWAGATR